SKLERVWLKYIQLARGRRRFHTLNGCKRGDVSREEYESELVLED
ncbi:DUF413 domain-containing protein, partial [Vibrio sp. 10N.247.311.14]